MNNQDGQQQEGERKPDLRSLTIQFDQANQRVGLKFEKGDFLTWDYILAVIDMARQHAEEQKRFVLDQERQQPRRRIHGAM